MDTSSFIKKGVKKVLVYANNFHSQFNLKWSQFDSTNHCVKQMPDTFFQADYDLYVNNMMSQSSPLSVVKHTMVVQNTEEKEPFIE